MITTSNRQFVFILIIFITSTADILLPSITTRLAGRDAWLSILGAALLGSVIVYLQGKLAAHFPGKSLPDYAGTLLGPYLGTLLILLYLFFLLIITLAVIGELIQITGTAFLRETPEIIFSFLIVLTAGYAIVQGIEVIARVVEFAFPLGMLVRIGLVFLVLTDLQVDRFLPILEQGTVPVLQGSLRVVSWLGEGIIVLFVSHHIKEIGKISFQLVMAIWFVTFLLLISSLYIGTFGHIQAANITFPLFEMIRFLEFGDFRGLDILIMTFWYSATLFKVVVLLYILTITVQNLTKHEYKLTITIPLMLVLTVLPVSLFTEMSSTIDFLKNIWPGFALTFELIIPAILLLLTMKNKSSRGEIQDESRS